MPHNEHNAYRVREALRLFPEAFTEKKMFGGVAYLYKGKMTVGVIQEDLMVRVVAPKMEEVLNREHVRPMDFTKKALKEFVFVAQDGFTTEEQLHSYIELGLEHAMNKLKQA